jgi:hypothetical protein
MIHLKDKAIKELERQHEIYENSLPHSYIKVVNAEDTSDDHPDNETSWREYWENRTGKDLDTLLNKKGNKYQCPCYNHHDKGDDGYVEMKDICGCHVQEVKENGDIKNQNMYIVPMCRGCNKRKDVFNIPRRLIIKLEE